MNTSQMFPSKWIKGVDLEDQDHTVTIKSVDYQEDKTKDNGVQYFLVLKEFPGKQLGLNKVNTDTIAGLYGPETDDWAGKRITIYPTEVEFAGKTSIGIRIRKKPPAAGAGHPTKAVEGPVLGGKAAERIAARLVELKMGLEDLRASLASQDGKDAHTVSLPPMDWPAAWMNDIAAWFKNPVKRGPGEDPIGEMDIPF